MNYVSCDICVYHLGSCVFFPGVFLSSRVTGACPVTTDLIMRVNVRTTTVTSRNIRLSWAVNRPQPVGGEKTNNRNSGTRNLYKKQKKGAPSEYLCQYHSNSWSVKMHQHTSHQQQRTSKKKKLHMALVSDTRTT